MPSSRWALPTAVALAAPALLSAQSIWITPLTTRGELGFEWVRPSFDDNTGLGNTRGVWIGSGRVRLSEGRAIVIAVPRLVGGGTSEFGAPYLGFQATGGADHSAFLLGARYSNSQASFGPDRSVALAADWDRFEQVAQKELIVHAEGQGQVWHDSAGADVTVRVGFTLFHPTESGSGTENSFVGDYGFRFGHRWTKLEAGAAVTGRFLLSGAYGSVTDRNTDQGAFDLAWHGKVAPRVSFRFPITGNLKSVYKYALTFGVEVPIE